MKKIALLVILVLGNILLPGAAWAADTPMIDTGDTAYMIICTALVMLMTPGLALFYGGIVRKKNVLNTMMQSFITIGIVSVQWVLIGYTLAFGTDHGGLIGSLEWIGLRGVGAEPNPVYAASIPHLVFVLFQLMFAIITPALITGSFAERMRFPAFIAFTLLWTTLIYDPLAHWVWADGGWLRNLGALDFAGGTVVHISSGISGLMVAYLLGHRKGFGHEAILPHQIPMTILGAGLLWFGWFGFNAGSALTANGLAASALLTTNSSAAAAGLSWVAAEWLHHGKPTALGAATGAVAGLVAITPGAGFVGPLSSIMIGLTAGIICYLAVAILKKKLGYDDSLDAFGVHGIGGILGALATGVFASTAVNPAGSNGLLFGGASLFGTQIIAIIATMAYAALGTYIILKVIEVFMPLRVTAEEEEYGLDLTQHGEEAYSELFAAASLMPYEPLISK